MKEFYLPKDGLKVKKVPAFVANIKQHIMFDNVIQDTSIKPSNIKPNTIYINCSLSKKIIKQFPITTVLSDKCNANIYPDITIPEVGIVVKSKDGVTILSYIQELNILFINGTLKLLYENEMWGYDIVNQNLDSITIQRIQTEEAPKKQYIITVGADPELEQTTQERAYNVIQTNVERIDGAEISVDGSGKQIEIHPKPTKHAWYITANIGRIIRKCPPVSVKGDVYPLGCHIHFGIPRQLHKPDYIRIITEAIDHFLGFLVDTSGDARGSYKQRRAWRSQPWGFEYRTIPSSILVSPEITYIVFKAAKNIAEYIINFNSITSNDNPTKEEYMKYCGLTEQEYNKLMQFPEYWKSIKDNLTTINHIWKRNTMSFLDEWKSETKFKLQRYLIKYNVKNVILYGLKKSRGSVVAGFQLDGYETIEHPIQVSYNYFGLPYDIRNSDISDELADNIAQAILQSIQSESLVSL